MPRAKSAQRTAYDDLRARLDAYASPANLAIIPLQDLMGLGSEARFNSPGKSQGNWTWRYHEEELQTLAQRSGPYLRELAALYGRDLLTPKTP